jgi:hypothetical protein
MVVANVAVTLLDAGLASVHGPVPVQAPLHPVKMDPLSAVAVSVTAVLARYVAVHVDPQLTPAGTLITVPAPLPAKLTVTVLVFAVNVAVTLADALPPSVQVPVPVQPPLQPANVDPVAAVAVNVTDVPAKYVALHVGPQLIPAGLLLTPPAPVPARLTETVLGFAVKVAVTLADPFPPSAQVPVPVQPPLQPANVDPLAGVAVNVTDVPAKYVALHVGPQLIPAGLLLTLPLPVPVRFTEIVLGFAVNVAVTLAEALPPSVQLPVPVHPPLHPANVDPLAAAAVKVTDVPAG